MRPILRRHRKGESSTILSGMLIKIIVAVIFILFLGYLLMSIWRTFFPGDDKTTIDNFNTLTGIINKQLLANKVYDSNKFPLYLKSDYAILYFPKDANNIPCTSGSPIFKPTTCALTDACLCLYDDNHPDGGESEKDDDIITCNVLKVRENTPLEVKAFELVDSACVRKTYKTIGNDKQFIGLIIATKLVDGKKELYVWENNEKNAELDKKNKEIKCPNTGSDPCKDKKYDEMLTTGATNCQIKGPQGSISQGKCVYDTAAKTCKVQCLQTVPCSEIRSCEDYTARLGERGAYFAKPSNAEYVCNQNTCELKESGNSITCTVQDTNQYMCAPDKISECAKKIQELKSTCAIGLNSQTSLITSISDTDSACATFKKEYLVSAYTCTNPVTTTTPTATAP